MTEIKIEKKQSSFWWLLALAAIVVGILLWLLVIRDPDGRAGQDAQAQSNNEDQLSNDMRETVSANGAPITDLAMISANGDGSLVGRDVDLKDMPVSDVSGDANFWINGADGQRVYVVLHEIATPDSAIEGRVDVDKGDRVDVSGTIHSAREGAPTGAAIGTKTDPLPDGITQYIYAKSATVVS